MYQNWRQFDMEANNSSNYEKLHTDSLSSPSDIKQTSRGSVSACDEVHFRSDSHLYFAMVGLIFAAICE